MSEHTKGPWKALEGKRGWQIHTDHAEGKAAAHINHWIANIKCESCPAHEEGNARLIAAAPDLLEALKWVRLNYASGPTAEINARIDAAITKAGG